MLLVELVRLALISSAAILVVAGLRKVLRRLAGAQLAYWLWLLVPCSGLAVLLPAPEQAIHSIAPQLTAIAAPRTLVESWVHAQGDATNLTGAVLWVWGFGSVGMLSWLLLQQWRFEVALGQIELAADGTYRSECNVPPLLLGILRPRIVLPRDFESFYDTEQRALIIAHERAHVQRGDAIVNALAALWLCTFWFNPLLYWALARLRFDQDLACDASVLFSAAELPRRYAEALLATQLAEDAAWLRPGVCHWGSSHPLTQRIAMINSLLPSRARRVAGTLLLSSVIVVCSCSAWAGQSSAPDTPEPAGRTLQVSAEHAQYAAGVYHYSGKVVVTVATAAGPLTVSSKQMEQRSDGSLVLSGEVRFEMAGSILYSDRAVIRRNGIIEMEHVDVTRTSEY